MICAHGFYFTAAIPPFFSLFFFCQNDGSLIFEMELFADIHTLVNVYACGIFHFAKCQSATLSERMTVWDSLFFFFQEAPSFVLRATWRSWIFHFLMRLLPVITRPRSPRTYYYRRYTLCLWDARTHTHLYTLVHTSSVTRARTLLSAQSHVPTHANPGGVFIY